MHNIQIFNYRVYINYIIRYIYFIYSPNSLKDESLGNNLLEL